MHQYQYQSQSQITILNEVCTIDVSAVMDMFLQFEGTTHGPNCNPNDFFHRSGALNRKMPAKVHFEDKTPSTEDSNSQLPANRHQDPHWFANNAHLFLTTNLHQLHAISLVCSQKHCIHSHYNGENAQAKIKEFILHISWVVNCIISVTANKDKNLTDSEAKIYETRIQSILLLFKTHYVCPDCVTALLLPKLCKIMVSSKDSEYRDNTYMSFFIYMLEIMCSAITTTTTNQPTIFKKKHKNCEKITCPMKTNLFTKCYQVAVIFWCKLVSQRYIIKFVLSNTKRFKLFLHLWFDLSKALLAELNDSTFNVNNNKDIGDGSILECTDDDCTCLRLTGMPYVTTTLTIAVVNSMLYWDRNQMLYCFNKYLNPLKTMLDKYLRTQLSNPDAESECLTQDYVYSIFFVQAQYIFKKLFNFTKSRNEIEVWAFNVKIKRPYNVIKNEHNHFKDGKMSKEFEDFVSKVGDGINASVGFMNQIEHYYV